MNIDEVLEAVEQILLSKQLSPIERLVLRHSLLGQTYGEMAQDSAYGSPHLKEIGSQLWQELSEALGDRVTKKNLYLVLSQYQQNRAGKPLSGVEQEFHINSVTQDKVPCLVRDTTLEFPSGPVPLSSRFYINRPPIEELAYSEIRKPGCVIRIKAPRKMGKSSLLNRILARATALGYKTVYLDFREAEEAIFASLDKFLRWFCANVSRQLNLNPMLDDYWDEDMGSKVSCKIYFEGYLLEKIDTPLVLALNEVNRIFEHPTIAQDFLPMLRFWHEQARVVEVWQKLRLVAVHTTEIYISLKINQSPFNVGLSLQIPQFSLEQVQELAECYEVDLSNGSDILELMAMVGGHPYLVSVALYHLCRRDMALEELLQTAPTEAGIYSDHLRGHLAILQQEPQLVSALRQVVTADESVLLEAITAYKLESLGLVQLDGNQAVPSCELYRLYFRQQLGQENRLEAANEALQKEKPEFQNLHNIDELTRLANRRYFNQYLETLWRQGIRDVLPLSLILCDIDCLRFYNDAHGQLAGDVCIQRIANAIQDCVRQEGAFVARYGGDEFAVILPQIDAKVAVEIAETIRQSIKALMIAADYPGVSGLPDEVLTVSSGVASTTPSPETSPQKLVTAALEALSHSKRQGRDRFTISSTLNFGLD